MGAWDKESIVKKLMELGAASRTPWKRGDPVNRP